MLNLIFDLDDTLYDLVEPFRLAYDEKYGDKLNIPFLDFYKRVRIHSDEVFELTESGKMSTEQMYIYRISKSFEDFGVSVTDEEALELQVLYAKRQGEIRVPDKVAKMLDYLKENNINIGIITNGNQAHQMKKVYCLEIEKWFDIEKIFVSGGINLAKPNKEIFEYVADKMELDLENTYYVGDTFLNDIWGSKNAGWKAIWINRRGYRMPTDSEYYPEFTVTNDDELLAVIKSLNDKED